MCSAIILKGHVNIPFFKKMTNNLNLSLSMYVILFSTHFNSQVIFYLVLTEADLGQSWPFWCSAATANGDMKIHLKE